MKSLIRLLIVSSLLVGMKAKAEDDPPSLLEQLKAAVADAVNKVSTPIESADVDKESEVTWHATLEEAVEEARENGKPILAVVGAPWCSFCEKLQEELQLEREHSRAMQKAWQAL